MANLAKAILLILLPQRIRHKPRQDIKNKSPKIQQNKITKKIKNKLK